MCDRGRARNRSAAGSERGVESQSSRRYGHHGESYDVIYAESESGDAFVDVGCRLPGSDASGQA